MAWHETGGTKLPRGVSLTIPGADFDKQKHKTKTGRVKKPIQPKTLLTNKDTKPKQRKALTRKGFIIPGRGSQPALLVRRIGRTPGPRPKRDPNIQVLYALKPRAKISATWGFRGTVERVAQKFFPRVFKTAMRHALRTAR
jgi:hypothetical protein